MTPEERYLGVWAAIAEIGPINSFPSLCEAVNVAIDVEVSQARLEALEEAAKIAENFAMTEVMQREWLASAVIADKIRKAKAK